MNSDSLVRGATFGAVAGALAVAAVGGAARIPFARRLFHDDRVIDIGRREALYHAAIRIPVATALSEEVLFRGVLEAALSRRRSPLGAGLSASLLFGFWHVLPTIKTYEGNPVSLSSRRRDRLGAIGASVVATSAAGSLFLWLRRTSGSLAAPVLAHAAINVSAYLVGRSVVKRDPVPRATLARAPGARPL